jgi:hypothetical protein
MNATVQYAALRQLERDGEIYSEYFARFQRFLTEIQGFVDSQPIPSMSVLDAKCDQMKLKYLGREILIRHRYELEDQHRKVVGEFVLLRPNPDPAEPPSNRIEFTIAGDDRDVIEYDGHVHRLGSTMTDWFARMVLDLF